MLQQLLNVGLVDIGADDSRFAKLESAAAELVEQLKGEPRLVLPMALIAIDANANEDDPVFEMVESHLIGHWKTMRNTHQNRPRELLRSIIIHALSLLTDDNPEMAALIWHTVACPMNNGQARLGNEAQIVVDLLKTLAKQAEDEAATRAQLVASPPKKQRSGQQKVAPIEITVKSSALLKDADILSDIRRSAGPQDQEGQAIEDPNPHWPNAGNPWSNEYTPRMTAAVVKAVNLGMRRVLKQLGESLESYTKPLEQRLASQQQSVDTVVGGIQESQKAVQLRLDVLWWSEAYYSPSLTRSYREMSQESAAIAMAHDLTQIVPAMAPASVMYILGEAVSNLLQLEANPSRQSVEILLRNVRANGSEIRDVLPAVPTDSGRSPLLALTLKAVGGGEVTTEDFLRTAGIDSALELSLPAFAMWTFRDMQACRLVEQLK